MHAVDSNVKVGQRRRGGQDSLAPVQALHPISAWALGVRMSSVSKTMRLVWRGGSSIIRNEGTSSIHVVEWPLNNRTLSILSLLASRHSYRDLWSVHLGASSHTPLLVLCALLTPALSLITAENVITSGPENGARDRTAELLTQWEIPPDV